MSYNFEAITPDEARAQVCFANESRKYQQPRNFVPFTGSHLQQALQWVAHNEYPQNLRFLYAAARLVDRRHGNDKLKYETISSSLDKFNGSLSEAKVRFKSSECKDPSILESLDYIQAAKWYDDVRPVAVFAINTAGECERIGTQYGYHDWTQDISRNTWESIQTGLDKIFPK